MKALDLRNSSDLQCVNMMCEKVGEACVCRLSRVLEKNGQELRSLCLADNKLTQLPDIVFELPHLQVLDLSGNALEDFLHALRQVALPRALLCPQRGLQAHVLLPFA